MANNRIFWAIQGFGLAKQSTTSFTAVHGLQSLGITTTFNLEEAFELGQLSIYENIENIPDVEVTVEKAIDGYPLLYHLATRGYAANTLTGRGNQQCNVVLNIYGDTQSAASGTPINEVYMSGMYISSVSYNMPVDGFFTESVTFVGNNREWRQSNYLLTGTLFDGNDAPLNAASGYGGIQRRQHFKWDVTSVSNPDGTLLPGGVGGIAGISSSGTNDKTGNQLAVHATNVTIAADFGREPMNELGRKGPYYRFMNFPIEVTCDVEVYCLSGDNVSATEAGVNSDGTNLSNKTIYIKLSDGTAFNLGNKNKLASVDYGGADAGGGNATCTYRFRNFNDLIITHPQDPG
jgi:hypothetical protein